MNVKKTTKKAVKTRVASATRVKKTTKKAVKTRARKEENLELLDHPRHYTSHPSGVEAMEIVEHMPPLLAAAFKYWYRRKFKGSEIMDLGKMERYIKRELANRKAGRLPPAPIKKFLDRERSKLAGYLWIAAKDKKDTYSLEQALLIVKRAKAQAKKKGG